MAMMLGGRKKRLVLDIGTSAVRLAEVSKSKSGYQLTRYFQKEFDSDPSFDEEKRRKLRSAALKEVLKQSKARLRKVIFGVPGQSVFTRSRTLPPVPEYKVNQIVKYEIQQQIPFGLDQIAMDYQVLSRNEQGGYEVMMAAIKVDVVDKHLDVLKSVKASVAEVDVCPLAAYNWLKTVGDFGNQGECVALVDIGATTTDIVIERDGQFRFTRPLNVGGNDVTKAMAAAFNMEFAAAEKLKRERGFAPTGDPQKDGRGGEVIGEALQRLATEVMRSFAYFRSLPGGGQVSRVVLSGGGARLRNIAAFLQRQLGMEVRMAQPLKGIEVSAGAKGVKDAPEQASAVLGMALRCCGAVPLEINLIPPRLLEVSRRKEQVVYWAFSIIAMVLSFLSVVPAAHRQNLEVKKRIEELKGVIRAYDPEMIQRIRPGTAAPSSGLNDQLAARKAQLQKIEQQVQALDRARNQRRFWLDELTLLNEARPATGGMWFSSVETMVIEDAQQKGGAAPAAPAAQGGLGGGLKRGGAGGMGGGAVTAAGFGGIDPKGGVAGPAGGGVRLGGRANAPAGPGKSGAAAPAGPAVSTIARPNGMIIQGYAESDQVITQFLDELKRAYYQMPNGFYLSISQVDFSEASVQKVSWDTLYNAPVDIATPVAAGGGAGLRRGGGAVSSQSSAGYQGGPSLYSFRIQVKFIRSKDRPNPQNTASPAGAPAPNAGAPAGGAAS